MTQNYDYSQRYENKEYQIERLRVKRQVQIAGGKNPRCLCPFCLSFVPMKMFKVLPGKRNRQQNRRWMESHHIGYGQNSRLIAACNTCHTGVNGNRRRSVLHHPSAWLPRHSNPELSRNTWLAQLSFGIQWRIGVGIAWLIRKVMNRTLLTGKKG